MLEFTAEQSDHQRQSLATRTSLSPGKKTRHVHYESDRLQQRAVTMKWTTDGTSEEDEGPTNTDFESNYNGKKLQPLQI
jgi:hypothetical protein